MTVKKIDGFKLSMSGSARQVIVQCHGGWSAALFRGGKKKSGDGYTFVPANTTLHFYTAHGTYTSGIKTAEAILEDAANSYAGLKQTNPGIPGWRKEFSIQCQESYGGQGSPVQVYNYSLSIDEAGGSKSVWQKHIAGDYDHDVDLLIVDTTKPRNLSDAFAACKSARGGSYYPVMHYCPCRYVEASDDVSMLSVGSS